MQIHPEHSPATYAYTAAPNSSAANASVSDHGGRALAIIALVLSAVALGAVLMVPSIQAARMDAAADRAAKAEREARVMQERWNDLKVELAKRGIPVSDH